MEGRGGRGCLGIQARHHHRHELALSRQGCAGENLEAEIHAAVES